MVVGLRALLYSRLDDFPLTCVSSSRQIAERLANKRTVKADGFIYIFFSATSSNVCRSMSEKEVSHFRVTQFQNVDIDIENSRENVKLNVVFPVREKRAWFFFVVVEEKDRIDKPADRDRGDITKRWRNGERSDAIIAHSPSQRRREKKIYK